MTLLFLLPQLFSCRNDTVYLLMAQPRLSESRKLYQIKAFTVRVSMWSIRWCEALSGKGLRAGQYIIVCTGLLVVCSVIIYHLNLVAHADQLEKKSVQTFKGVESLNQKRLYNVWAEVSFTFCKKERGINLIMF